MRTSDVSRRRFIRVVAGTGGALMANNVTSVFGKTPLPAPDCSGINHIIVVMLENRSFDHFLGWLPRANGRQSGLVYYDSNGVSHSTYALADNTMSGNYEACGFTDPDHSFEGGRVEYNRYVAHDRFDHTSVLRMIEWRFGLAPLTVRDRTANNLANVLDFNHQNVLFNTYSVPVVVSDPCGVAPSGPSAINEFAILGEYAQSLGFASP